MVKYILFLLTLFSSGAFANFIMFGSPSYVSVTSSSSVVLPQNNLRTYLLIVNSGANAIYVKFGAPASTTSIPIPAGGNYEPLQPPSNSVNLICPTGSFATVIEGQ